MTTHVHPVSTAFAWGSKPTTVDEFIAGYAIHHTAVTRDMPNYRLGQAMANYVQFHFPGVMCRLYGTRFDTYYTDSRGRRADLTTYLVDNGYLTW